MSFYSCMNLLILLAPSDPATLESVRSAHIRYANAVQTVVTTSDVVERTTTTPDFQIRYRESRHRSIDSNLQEAIADAELRDLPPEAVQEIVARHEQERQQIEGHIAVIQLNTKIPLQRTRWLDFTRTAARQEDRDHRDLAAIVAQNSQTVTSFDHRLNLNRTRSSILLADRKIEFFPMLPGQALATPFEKFNRDAELEQLGVLPANVLNDASVVLRTGAQPGTCYLETSGSNGSVSRYELRQDIGFRIARIERIANGSVFEEHLFSDHRTIGSLEISFHVVTRRHGQPAQSLRSTEIAMRDVTLNTPIDASRFETPGEVRVADWTEAEWVPGGS